MRRVPSLPRFTRSRGFRDLHATAEAWVSRNFELIEGDAPWLDRTGCQVADFCHSSLVSRPFSVPRDPPSVMCARDVTVVYGFDDRLAGRLAELSAVLHRAGWGELIPGWGKPEIRAAAADMTEQLWLLDSPAKAAWWPTEAFPYPDALRAAMPPARRIRPEVSMSIAWATATERAELSTERVGMWRPTDIKTASLIYQPVAVDDASIAELAEQALAAHEQVLGIRVGIDYYLNMNVRAPGQRIPKRLLPVRGTPLH